MSVSDEDHPPRRGTTASLEGRVERLEAQYERIDAKVDDLNALVARVELNQKHADEVSKLRSESIINAVTQLTTKTDLFIARIEGMITGEVPNVASRNAERQLAEWTQWRVGVDTALKDSGIVQTQLRLLARLALLLTGGSIAGLAIAIYAAFFK